MGNTSKDQRVSLVPDIWGGAEAVRVAELEKLRESSVSGADPKKYCGTEPGERANFWLEAPKWLVMSGMPTMMKQKTLAASSKEDLKC